MTLLYRDLLSWNYQKLGPEIMTINTSTATDCPCQDTCKDREICYAKTMEHFRPSVLKKNARQAELFKTLSFQVVLDCIDHFLQIPSGQKIKYLRWNSFGDWPNIGILAKAALISMEIKSKHNIDSVTRNSRNSSIKLQTRRMVTRRTSTRSCKIWILSLPGRLSEMWISLHGQSKA